MDRVSISLLVLAGFVVLLFISVILRTRRWHQKEGNPPLKGLALPEGSIRGIIGLIVVAAFVVFVFFGPDLFNEVEETHIVDEQIITVKTKPDRELYTTVLTAFGTLTGAVTGFYFGGRSSQKRETERSSNQSNGGSNGSARGPENPVREPENQKRGPEIPDRSPENPEAGI